MSIALPVQNMVEVFLKTVFMAPDIIFNALGRSIFTASAAPYIFEE